MKKVSKTLNDILFERGYKALNTFGAMFDENAFDGHVGMHYFLKKFDNYAIKIGNYLPVYPKIAKMKVVGNQPTA